MRGCVAHPLDLSEWYRTFQAFRAMLVRHHLTGVAELLALAAGWSFVLDGRQRRAR